MIQKQMKHRHTYRRAILSNWGSVRSNGLDLGVRYESPEIMSAVAMICASEDMECQRMQ